MSTSCSLETVLRQLVAEARSRRAAMLDPANICASLVQDAESSPDGTLAYEIARMCDSGPMMEDGSTAAAEQVWQQQSIWSQTANRLKRSLDRSRQIGLGLIITGAVLATLATQVATLNSVAGKLLAFGTAVAVGLVPLLNQLGGQVSVRDWTRARSVSETLKSEVYTFLARVAPYRDPDRDQKLQDGVARVLQDADDLLRHTAGIVPESRHLPPVDNVDSYLKERVSQQIDRYYRPKAGELRRTLSYLQRAQAALGVLSVLLAALAATLQVTQAAAWVAVITTITAALTAHAAASRLEYQQVEYLRTAAELERLRSQRGEFSQRGPAGDDEFVQRCEHVISVQNEAWMAKLISAKHDEHKLQPAYDVGGKPSQK